MGIGGSYLGARAAIEFLKHNFFNSVGKDKRNAPEIYFLGNNISTTYIHDLIEVIGDRDFSINMISKSGTTTEPVISFRIFKDLLEKKYGKEAASGRIYATTDAHKGALKSLADAEGGLTGGDLMGDELVSALIGSRRGGYQKDIAGAETLTFDFSKLAYISSAGLRVLLSAHKTMSPKGGMKVTNVNDIVQEVFEVTGFADILDIE